MKAVINYQEYADVEIEKAVLRELSGIEIVESRTLSPEEFASEVRDANAVILQYVQCTRDVIDAMTCAKVIVRYGIAVDNIDLVAAKERGIVVCHVPNYCLDEVSNHALALILSLHRRLPAADRLLRSGEHTLEAIRPIPRLSGATAGLLGFGNIARTLAVKLKPLFARLISYDPFVDAKDMAVLEVRKVELVDLFQESDFVSVHIPLTSDTRHLVDKWLIGKMKPSACIVNTSRGAVVHETALIDALREGGIAGAALDVFETEPLPDDSPLRSMENVIITSHVAWYSEGAIRELKETAATEALRVLKGQRPMFEVPA